MLGRTLVTSVALTAIVAALPYSFVLDTGSVDGIIIDTAPPAQLPDTTSSAFASMTFSQQTSSTSPIHTPTPTSYSNTTNTAPNSTTSATSLLTTTTTPPINLPNPTPRPNPDTNRSPSNSTTNTNSSEHTQTDPFTTSTALAVSKWPHWFTAATFTLVFYDIITLGLFLWLWVFGYLWWFRRRGSRRGAVAEPLRMRAVRSVDGDGRGRYERTAEWVRGGRVRSLSWERVRGRREGELEGEMRRLGMI